MEVSDWLEVLDLMKVVWRFVWTTDGVQCVMMLGELWMPVWPADSLDTLHTVSIWTLRKLNATNTCFIRLVTDHDLLLFISTTTIALELKIHLFFLFLHHRRHSIFICPFWSGNWSDPPWQCCLHWNWRCSCELYLWQWHIWLLPLWGRQCVVPTWVWFSIQLHLLVL